MNSTLYIVIPCYKEQEVLHETASRLKVKMESLIASRQNQLGKPRHVCQRRFF